MIFYPKEQQLSIDESTVPYYRRHGCKQFIKGKPIRYGYKVWCLNTKFGYLFQFEAYQGAGTVEYIDDLCMGGSVVMDLISELPQNFPYELYFDNFFTNFALIDHLSKKGIAATGTRPSN